MTGNADDKNITTKLNRKVKSILLSNQFPVADWWADWSVVWHIKWYNNNNNNSVMMFPLVHFKLNY